MHFAHHARWPPTQGRFPLPNGRAHGGSRVRIPLLSVDGRGYDHHENQERIFIYRSTSLDATVLEATRNVLDTIHSESVCALVSAEYEQPADSIECLLPLSACKPCARCN